VVSNCQIRLHARVIVQTLQDQLLMVRRFMVFSSP
jgi:hypothetical protein